MPIVPTVISRPIRSTFFGMHGFGPADRRTLSAIAGSVRSPEAEWARVQPTRSRYNWTGVDRDIAMARARGASEVLFVIGGTPRWAAGPNRSSDRRSPVHANPPRRAADWDRYVAAVATHLKGKPVAFQVWNEANLTTFWNGTPEQVAALTARAYRIIKRIAPKAPVIAASTTMRMTASYRAFYPRYLAALRAYGWPVDAFSVHTYPPSTGTPATFAAYLRTARATLARAGAGGKPLWVTEMNYGLAGPGPRYPLRRITGATAAAWVARTYLEGLRYGLGKIYWYSQLKREPSLGIRMWAGESAVSAQRYTTLWLSGATWRGCSTRGAVVYCGISRGQSVAVFVWTDSGTGRVTVPRTLRRACDILGRCRAVRPGSVITVGAMPIRLSR